jgi:hypothetical protein
MLNETNMPCSGEEAGHTLLMSIAIVLSVLLSLIVIPSLYGIIWFERFGSDSKRTLINQLFASVCWYLMAIILCLQTPIIFRIITRASYSNNICGGIEFLIATFYNVVLGNFKFQLHLIKINSLFTTRKFFTEFILIENTGKN